jgi:D-serine deaminase-like pyridoxal phosphate-dependent protein
MTAEGMTRLKEVIDALNAAGFAIRYVTGGGTGTAMLDLENKVFTELQCGSYVFMDRQYREALGENGAGAFQHALFVQAEIVSANAEKWVTVDAGLKAFSTDGPLPMLASAYAGEGADFFYYGDEHGGLPHAATHRFKLGERVEFIPPHCDPTVDRHDWLHLVRGDVLIDIVPIEARGRSS